MSASHILRGLLVSAALASPALADRIDGTWCKPNSRDRMTIDGETVITPAGNTVTARYTRHSIDYAVPKGERPDGGRIHAEQINDRTIDVARLRKVQIEPPAHDHWTRCEDVS